MRRCPYIRCAARQDQGAGKWIKALTLCSTLSCTLNSGTEIFGISGALKLGKLKLGAGGAAAGASALCFASGADADPPVPGSEKLKLGGDAGACFGTGALLEPCMAHVTHLGPADPCSARHLLSVALRARRHGACKRRDQWQQQSARDTSALD